VSARESVDGIKARRNDRDVLWPFLASQIRREDRAGFGIGNDDKPGLALAVATCGVGAAKRLKVLQRPRDVALSKRMLPRLNLDVDCSLVPPEFDILVPLDDRRGAGLSAQGKKESCGIEVLIEEASVHRLDSPQLCGVQHGRRGEGRHVIVDICHDWFEMLIAHPK
jgi:hypothetical protein